MTCCLEIGDITNKIRFNITSIQGVSINDSDFYATLDIDSHSIHVGAHYTAYTEALSRFHEELKSCYETLRGKAVYKPFFDDGLTFSVTMKKRGYCTVEGTFDDVPNMGNSVNFSFETEQTYLAKTLQQLAKIEDYISVVYKTGKPICLDEDIPDEWD